MDQIIKEYNELHKEEIKNYKQNLRKEYLKTYHALYYDNNKEKIIKKSKEYHKENKNNPEYIKRIRESSRKSYYKDIEKSRERNRKALKKYYEKNREKVRNKRMEYYYKNKDKEAAMRKTRNLSKSKLERRIIAEYMELHKEEIKEYKRKISLESQKIYQRLYYFSKTKPKRKENKKGICEICHCNKGEYQTDPYQEEINERIVKRYICPQCLEELILDI